VTHPRRRPRRDGKRVHVVDYRHVLPALRRKPQAFADSVYRDGLFPAPAYAEAWRRLSNALPRRDACKRIVGLLVLAHDHACEAELAELIAAELAAGRLPDANGLRARLRPPASDLPDRPVALTPLAHFDRLMEARP